MISGAQVRAARALLGWTVRDLARHAIVSITAVNLIEGATGLPSTTAGAGASCSKCLGNCRGRISLRRCARGTAAPEKAAADA
jgi:hypothetical protein